MTRFERVLPQASARDGPRALAERSRPVLLEVFRPLEQRDAGSVTPVPLHDHAGTGDRGDCGKLVVALAEQPEHRIVVRDVTGWFHVSEVVAVEQRADDLPYLLAGLRLGRLDDPVRRSDALRRIQRLRGP